MDLFLAACQGVGLALAAGALAGAVGVSGRTGYALIAIAAVAGAALFGISLAGEDHPAWPGWPVGALLATFSAYIVGDFAAGAAARGGDTAVNTGALAVTAFALAGLSLLFGPLGLLALAALLWLFGARRRSAARKYEGLRTLR